MRLFTFDIENGKRLRRRALCLAMLTAIGAGLSAPASAHEVAEWRGAAMQLAMLPGGSAVVAAMFPVARDVGNRPMRQASVMRAVGSDDEATAVQQANEDSFAGPTSVAHIDDSLLGNERGRNASGLMLQAPGFVAVNGVTLWDELPGSSIPMPRPQQLSNGTNVQVTRVTYSR